MAKNSLLDLNNHLFAQLPAELKESGLLLAKLKIATAAAVRKL